MEFEEIFQIFTFIYLLLTFFIKNFQKIFGKGNSFPRTDNYSNFLWKNTEKTNFLIEHENFPDRFKKWIFSMKFTFFKLDLEKSESPLKIYSSLDAIFNETSWINFKLSLFNFAVKKKTQMRSFMVLIDNGGVRFRATIKNNSIELLFELRNQFYADCQKNPVIVEYSVHFEIN